MDSNQPKKKNAGLTALIALLLIITTVASCIGIYAWAKYISSQSGNASAQIAKWSFNVSLKAGSNQPVALGSGAIDMATTEYNHVASHKIAPGTAGEFDIIIDTSTSEVDLQYDVTLTLANCPRNITFSKKGPNEQTATVISAGGASNPATLARTITFNKYVTKSQNGTFTEKIYWNWPYEADANAEAAEKLAYDQRDNADQAAAQNVTMTISVTGTEKLSNPNAAPADVPGTVAYVATHASTSEIARGQSVTYTPDTASISDDTLTIAGASLIGDTKVASVAGASLSGTINSSEAGDWVILDYNETTGEVKIIPRTYSSKTLELSGMDGYNNAIKALDAVAAIYGNATYAESARSLTVEDVNKIENHTPNGVVNFTVFENDYAMNNSLDIVSSSAEDALKGSIETESNSETTLSVNIYSSTATTGDYDYSLNDFRTLMGNGKISCWLASRCVGLDSYNCYFHVRTLDGWSVDYHYLFYVLSGGGAYGSDHSYPVVPVVTLKSDIHMTKNGNTWTLSQN